VPPNEALTLGGGVSRDAVVMRRRTCFHISISVDRWITAFPRPPCQNHDPVPAADSLCSCHGLAPQKVPSHGPAISGPFGRFVRLIYDDVTLRICHFPMSICTVQKGKKSAYLADSRRQRLDRIRTRLLAVATESRDDFEDLVVAITWSNTRILHYQ
jgi:hypothetical protein